LWGGGARHCSVYRHRNFPGCVLVTAGECLKIIRIENGMLGELVGCFLDSFQGKILPAGSTVVLFSATHLLMRGLSGYISDLSTEMNRLDRVFRGGSSRCLAFRFSLTGATTERSLGKPLNLGSGRKQLANRSRLKRGRPSDPALLRIRTAAFSGRKKRKFRFRNRSGTHKRKNLG